MKASIKENRFGKVATSFMAADQQSLAEKLLSEARADTVRAVAGSFSKLSEQLMRDAEAMIAAHPEKSPVIQSPPIRYAATHLPHAV